MRHNHFRTGGGHARDDTFVVAVETSRCSDFSASRSHGQSSFSGCIIIEKIYRTNFLMFT